MHKKQVVQSLVEISKKKQKESTHRLRRQNPKTLEEFEIQLAIRDTVRKRGLQFCPGCGAELISVFGFFDGITYQGTSCPRDCELKTLFGY